MSARHARKGDARRAAPSSAGTSPGRLQVTRIGNSRLADTTTAYTYQTPAYATTLQAVGTGRMAMATGTITVEGLDGPIQLWGLGNLSAPVTGQWSVTMQ